MKEKNASPPCNIRNRAGESQSSIARRFHGPPGRPLQPHWDNKWQSSFRKTRCYYCPPASLYQGPPCYHWKYSSQHTPDLERYQGRQCGTGGGNMDWEQETLCWERAASSTRNVVSPRGCMESTQLATHLLLRSVQTLAAWGVMVETGFTHVLRNVMLLAVYAKWTNLVEGVWYTGSTNLVHVYSNLTAVRYRDIILQPHVLPAIDVQRELFQRDNARPHIARVTSHFLAANNINVLPCLSPDINPIEHLWDELDRHLRQRKTFRSKR